MAIFLSLAIGGTQAGRLQTAMPDSSLHASRAAVQPAQAPDLDLSLDLDDEAAVPAAPSPAPSQAWKYWLAAGAAMAAGGAGWLWYEASRPTTIRTEQVFTDEQ